MACVAVSGGAAMVWQPALAPAAGTAAKPIPAAAPADDFAKVVQPFLTQHCDRCHNADKQKGEFRVDTLSRDFASGASAHHWAEVMGKISAGEMPPKKEPQPNAAEAARVVDWLAGKLKEGEAARLAARERISFHRLTRDEYAATIRDLLGVQYDATDPTGLPEDSDWNGFERIGSVLSLSPAHIEKYFIAAESILTEAFPPKPVTKILSRRDAIDLRGGPNRQELKAQGLENKVRVDLWPGADLQGGRIGPGSALPASGEYRVRIQLSGLKPKNGRAPHLAFYAVDLDRMLFEQDVVAPEDKPTIVEFTTHLPAGNINLRLTNDVPGPSNLPRSGRSDPRIPFFSIKEGRRPWQTKLTDDEGQPILPFLIVDWIEWEGPLGAGQPTYAQREYTPATPDLPGAQAALTKFMERAFRRPVQAGEVARYLKVIEGELKSGEKFDSAYRAGLLAVLCSKDFLYVIEGAADAPRDRLTDWELASRLSYFLWGTMPDAALFDAARKGVLSNPAELAAQTRRMLADPKAHNFVESFTRQWLQLRKVGMFPPDKKLYPNYDTYLEKSMVGETTAFFAEVLRNNLTLREFIDSNWTMMNARLAAHYGMPGVEQDRFVRVPLKPEDRRGGVLTHASVLSLTSDGTRHRPVHRGKWVLESIIGRPPPPPPANVKPIEPTPATQPKATLRMKLEAHKSDANCAACHAKIDPLGLAFDNYDAIGRWRTEEVVSDGAGSNPKVDASGELPDGRRFKDAGEFKKLLLSDIDSFNAAFIEKLATYATRRTMTYDDREALTTIANKSRQSDYRLMNLIEAFVTSDLFRQR
jgi:mono/diheme cytochrome c family protein